MMRVIFFLLLIFLSVLPSLAQEKPPTQIEMQAQMLEAINQLNIQIIALEKQLVDAKKNKEDAGTIKGLEDQIVMLKKQVAMMGRLKTNVSGISDNIVQKAGEKEAIVPKRDVARISMLPKKIFTTVELVVFLKSVHAQVEKMIPADEKTEALKIYNETKAEYKSLAVVANAASGCWMIGHWEKALYIMGRACIDDITNADNLNNYAAFFISTGAEHVALPILAYLDNMYPKNSTILNNIGQAWFGLGEIGNAKKYLDSATALYPNHSMANATLADISLSNGDSSRSIAFLKIALKETYDPDKEAQLEKLGYSIKLEDLPPLNYPMKKDPFGLIPLILSVPGTIQSSLDNPGPSIYLQEYSNGLDSFSLEIAAENVVITNKLREQDIQLSSDSAYRESFLKPHNSPAYKLAGRSLQLYHAKRAAVPTPAQTSALPIPQALGLVDMFPVGDILIACRQIWFDSVIKPVSILSIAFGQTIVNTGCQDADAKLNEFLAKRSAIFTKGVELIKTEFTSKSYQLSEWIKYNLYAITDKPPVDVGDLTFALVNEINNTSGRLQYMNSEYSALLSLLHEFSSLEELYKSKCVQNSTPPTRSTGAVNLSRYKVPRVECEFKQVIGLGGYLLRYDLQCNTITEKSKYKPKKGKVKRGSAESSSQSRLRNMPGPLSQGRGPNNTINELEENPYNFHSAPLCAADKDPSQFSIEYDRWGNLIGFNFQLNKEGTALADPNSKESGIEGRWSWNAAGSAQKGFLNKLIIK